MKSWFISDAHCEHQNLNVPIVDAVIHCGDESGEKSLKCLVFIDGLSYDVFVSVV